LILTSFGEVGLVWAWGKNAPSVVRIFLPVEYLTTKANIHLYFPGAIEGTHDIIDQFCSQILEYLCGAPVVFSLENINLSICREFQQKVLHQNMRVPRGFVSSYSLLSDKLSIPKGARAVGCALAGNPFPLIIPCHRIVRLNGTSGGYGGGLKMKIALLQMEGVAFDESGKINPRCFW